MAEVTFTLGHALMFCGQNSNLELIKPWNKQIGHVLFSQFF